jgi:hypothetical protein
MSREFVSISAETLRATFEKAGFCLVHSAAGYEEVYARSHHVDTRYVVKVYSTIPKAGTKARGRGKDAIRVVAVFDGAKTYGVFKAKRVHRMGSVEATIERMLGRMREAYGFINGRVKEQKR